MRDDRVCLFEILESIRKIQKYTGEGRAAFFTNGMAQDAVVRNIEIMGEASRASLRLSKTLTRRFRGGKLSA